MRLPIHGPTFLALTALGVLAVVLALPPPPPPLPLAAGALAVILIVALGLRVSRVAGYGAPLLDRTAPVAGHGRSPVRTLALGASVGAVLGIVLLAGLALLLARAAPALRERLVAEAGSPWWVRVSLSYEAGVSEELVFRLLVLSGVAWAFARASGPRADAPAAEAVAVTVSALLFGAAHVPKWLALAPDHPAPAALAFALDTLGGVVLGLLFTRRGLEAAITAHVAADLVLHVLGPALLKP